MSYGHERTRHRHVVTETCEENFRFELVFMQSVVFSLNSPGVCHFCIYSTAWWTFTVYSFCPTSFLFVSIKKKRCFITSHQFFGADNEMIFFFTSSLALSSSHIYSQRLKEVALLMEVYAVWQLLILVEATHILLETLTPWKFSVCLVSMVQYVKTSSSLNPT